MDMGMENLKNGIKIEKLDICPFFYIYDWDEKDKYSCKEEVNFLYVVEYCIKGFRKCKTFTQRALLERKTPEDWIKTISWSFEILDLGDYFRKRKYIKCPVYPECETRVVYDHFAEKCCGDFDRCDTFQKAIYHTREPSDWYRSLSKLIHVDRDEEEDEEDVS
jgi:hypothetical protein